MGMMNSDRTCTGIRDRYSPLAIQVTRATGLQRPTMPRQGNTGLNWEGLPKGMHYDIQVKEIFLR